MKVCHKCGFKAKIHEIPKFFPKHKSPDGYEGECKACKKIYKKKYRLDNLEKIKADMRLRSRDPSHVAKVILYSKTERGRQVSSASSLRYRLKHQLKRTAHIRVAAALKNGKLIKYNCEVCNKPSEAHHDDYTKPLEVRWLCRKHHRQFHLEEREKARALLTTTPEHGVIAK